MSVLHCKVPGCRHTTTIAAGDRTWCAKHRKASRFYGVTGGTDALIGAIRERIARNATYVAEQSRLEYAADWEEAHATNAALLAESVAA